MKRLATLLILTCSLNSFAEVVCGEGKVFMPDPEFSSRWRLSTETANELARKDLNSKIASIITVGKAGIYNGKPIQMKSKSVSKPDVANTNSSMTAAQCIRSSRSDTGICVSASICVTVEMDYIECKPTKYEEDTGERYAICPNGEKVFF
jgi:hypothetical protein